MTKRLLCFLLLLCCSFSGCAGRNVEEELLVIVLAIDRAESGNVTVAVKVPANASAAGAENGAGDSQGQSGYMQLEATGHSFTDAVSMLNATTPRRLNFSQVREVVIGDEAARRRDFATLLTQIDALPRFRCSAAVIICRGSALQFAENQKPIVGMRLSRYAENTLANYAGKGFTPNTDLCAGRRDLDGGFRDPLFILGDVNDFSGADEPSPDNSLSAEAGDLPRRSIEAVEMFGAAATDGVSVCGYLTGYEMALLHLIEGHVEALTVRVDGVPLHVTASGPAALSVDVSRSPAVLRVDLRCEAKYPQGSEVDENNLQTLLERDIFALIAHLQALRCDGVGFGQIAVRRFLTVQDWEAFGWREVYTAAQAQVRVTVQLRGS
ncbi:MAG: hypothetical protein IJJ60_14520 [Clostridia bacterium]|nr:hypothetical protein [Clostridia bacterium]